MNFPPMMTEGSSRAFKFASSFPALGWEPIVIAYHEVSGIEAERLPFRVHYAGHTYSAKEMDPEQLFRLVHGLPLKKLFFKKEGFPQSKNGIGENSWERKAATLAEQLLQEDSDIEMIYAQAPPFAPHRLALELSAKYHIPVMFDCTTSFVVEKQDMGILHSGHCVAMPSRVMKEFFLRKYRGRLFHEDISIVRNGYDPECCHVMSPQEQAGVPILCVFHIERAEGKELKNFFSGLSAFVKSQEGAKGFFSIAFTGPGYEKVRRYLKKYRLEDFVEAGPVCSHGDELELCMRADLYCVVLGKADGYELFVPERLYDIMGMKTSLGGLLPDGLAKKVIHEAGGRTASIERVESIVDFLQDTFSLWLSGQLPTVSDTAVGDYCFRSSMKDFLGEMATRLPMA
ncbi:hypothetical protein CR164_03540 [Prosthecochloris marina]|uniref:Glycosyltransferase subfamily 4-like N-terminal domain-containing protein n=1 Tax=Prosthecochloris marina TaxID=2017681 RepID=A0A317T813_9CHLB|nr:hypothetical protein [Prosthecochloris marina]PWW82824.1 hypothetical protein CR164_03540 [Prosthecochloris marina]